MSQKRLIAVVMLCVTLAPTKGAVIIGGSIGNGDFEATEPAASGAQNYADTPHWHNASGSETTVNFTQDSGTVGSPQPNSRAAMPLPPRAVNDTGYTVTAAGETFDLSLALHQFGNAARYDGDEFLRAFLFTASAPVDGNLTTSQMTELGEVRFAVDGSWVNKSATAFYTATAAEVGQTVYFGMQLLNPAGLDVFPRLDVLQLEVREGGGPTNPPAGPVIIGGAIGNGDFEDSEPATGALPYEQTAHWFNASGDETLNFTQDSQTGGSSQPNSRAGMPFQNRRQVNDSAYAVTRAGETFNLSYDFGAGGGGWDGDEQLRTFLFTATAPVDGNLTPADMTEFAEVIYSIPADPQWTTFSTNGFYTTTAADIGKTFYFGLEMQNPAGLPVFPRIDVIQWTHAPASTNPPPVSNGWEEFVHRYGLSGDKAMDTDADGQLDYHEFLHGGNPTNAASLATVPSLQLESNGVLSYFSVETGHTNPGIPFTAEWTDNLTSGVWQSAWDTETNMAAARPGYQEVVRRLDPGTNDQVFCRVRPLNAVHRPNILVILADDLGYADVSFNVEGTPDIRTPNLDRLAHAGTIFTAAYVAHPFCGPSRMALFSGRYPHEYGGPFNLPDYSSNQYRDQGIPAGETLISTGLRDAGYFTGIMGKWHMGQQPEHHPNHRGFDDFFGFLGGGHNYFGPYEPQNAAGTVWDYKTYPEHNGTPVTHLTANDYLTDVLTGEGVRFLNQAATNRRPFFLVMSYNAPHTPLQAKPSDMDMFPLLTGDRKTYAGMVYALDRGVGELVAALKANGQFENTLIVFLSDNGGKVDAGANNLPLKGTKGDVWEGGFRVPMFMHLPNVIPAGQKYHHPVTALDFYPTFARLAGASLPPGKELDGRDIWNDVILTRNARPGAPIFTVRYRIGFGSQGITDVGIRQDRWKAVKAGGTNWRLFDITSDIGERTDLSGSHPTVLSNLVSEAQAWSQTHLTPLWYDNLQAEQDWIRRGMPHYAETFSLP